MQTEVMVKTKHSAQGSRYEDSSPRAASKLRLSCWNPSNPLGWEQVDLSPCPVASCHSLPPGGTPGQQPGWTQELEAILGGKCISCNGVLLLHDSDHLSETSVAQRPTYDLWQFQKRPLGRNKSLPGLSLWFSPLGPRYLNVGRWREQ